MIGDMIHRDVLVGKNANIKTCYLSWNPSKPHVNKKYIEEGEIVPDYKIHNFSELHDVVKLMQKDYYYKEPISFFEKPKLFDSDEEMSDKE